jgi:hypothetical protein
MAMNLNMAFAVDLSPQRAPLHIHFGLMDRLSNGATDTTYYGLNALYPFFRFQTGTLFFTLGATPIVYAREDVAFGFENFNPLRGGMSYFGEVGYEAVITPEISVNFAAATHWVNWNNALSPRPILDMTASFRLYFGWASSFKDNVNTRNRDEREAGEYKGWRYPYGTPLN